MRKLAITGGGLVILGTIGLLLPLTLHILSFGIVVPHGLPDGNKTSATQLVQPMIKGEPVGISIPSLNINLSVIDGYYNDTAHTWTLTSDKAQFATPSLQPNNHQGNTLIYGHEIRRVFASLHSIKTGDEAIVITSNGYRFIYKFEMTYATTPTDMSIFDYKGAPILTLQTCSGTWYQNRQMYQFSYISYLKT